MLRQGGAADIAPVSLSSHLSAWALWAYFAEGSLSWSCLGEKGSLGATCLLGELPLSACPNESPKERECGRAGVRVLEWRAGRHSLCLGPHLAQGFDAHQVHKADPTHIEDDGVEGDKGWDAGQHVPGLTGGLGGGWRRTGGSWGAVRAEGDVGHADAISRSLVVVGVRWGGVLKVLLKLLQGDSLEGGGRGARDQQTELDFAAVEAGERSVQVEVNKCRWW